MTQGLDLLFLVSATVEGHLEDWAVQSAFLGSSQMKRHRGDRPFLQVSRQLLQDSLGFSAKLSCVLERWPQAA